jgi:hypothetical protein
VEVLSNQYVNAVDTLLFLLHQGSNVYAVINQEPSKLQEAIKLNWLMVQPRDLILKKS